MAKKKLSETAKKNQNKAKTPPPSLINTTVKDDLEQITLNEFDPIQAFSIPQRATPSQSLDPVEESIRTNLPAPSGVYFPSSVQKSFSTSDAMSAIFNNLSMTQVPEDFLLAQSRIARAKIMVDTNKLILPSTFSEFDRAVLEAVLAQLAAGNKVMTSSMIFRTMSGKSRGTNISDDMLEAVDNSITKCMLTPFMLPLRDEETGEVQTFDGTVLNVIRNTRNVAGHMVNTYEVQSIPAIYQFCKAINAVTYSPIDMLSVPMSATKRSLAILNALQRAVAPFVWNSLGENMVDLESKDVVTPTPITILYEALYEVAAEQDGKEYECDENGKKKVSWYLIDKARKTTETVLNYWKQMGYIKDWKQNKRAQKIDSLTVTFFPVNKRFLPLPDVTPLVPSSALPPPSMTLPPTSKGKTSKKKNK